MAGIFQESVLTHQGIALLTKAQAGKCTIKMTKAETGSGSYAIGEDLASRTTLKERRQTFPLISVSMQNQSSVFAKFIMTNKQDTGNLQNGYYVKEIGIFAMDPDEGEILYSIAIGVENQWDFMPAYNDLLPSTITVDFLMEVSNADAVTIVAPAERLGLYDSKTGEEYLLGIENGLLYCEDMTGENRIFVVDKEDLEEFRREMRAFANSLIVDLIIPVDGWAEANDNNKYAYKLDIQLPQSRAEYVPSVALDEQSQVIAWLAQVSPPETLDGILRFRSKNIPTAAMNGRLVLFSGNGNIGTGSSDGSAYVLPIATRTRLGGVRIGSGIGTTEDGTISVNGMDLIEETIATDDEVQEVLDSVFNSQTNN